MSRSNQLRIFRSVWSCVGTSSSSDRASSLRGIRGPSGRSRDRSDRPVFGRIYTERTAPWFSDGFRILGFLRKVWHRWDGPLVVGALLGRQNYWILIRVEAAAVGILALVGIAVAEIRMS